MKTLVFQIIKEFRTEELFNHEQQVFNYDMIIDEWPEAADE